MKKYLKIIHNYIYSHDVPIDHRMSFLFIIMGVIAAFLGTILCLCIGVVNPGLYTVISILAGTPIILLLSQKFKKEYLVNDIVAVFVLIAMPIIWIYAGGINSGVNMWFMYELFFFTIALSGKKLAVVLALGVLLDTGCYVIYIIKPDIIHTLPDPISAVISVVGSTVIVAFCIIFTNICQKKIYVDENKKLTSAIELQENLKKEADNANRAKSDFLANMSHEIRTPINAVLGMDEMILRNTEDEDIKEYASNIKIAGNSLLSIINDILDISKIESGKMEIVPIEFDFGNLVEDVLLMNTPKAAKKNLEMLTDISESIPRGMIGDDLRIRQVITNLVSNAVKYTHRGSVTFIAKGEYIDDETFDLYVAIKDTGIGIKDEDKDKMFNAFQRLDQNTNRSIEGTGLGLSITLNFLRLMGSELKVESTIGKGSTFYFNIKLKVTDKTPVGKLEDNYKLHKNQVSVYREGFVAPDAKILVVDDNAMNLKIMQGLLKNSKMKIDTVSSGFDAIECMKREYYDIVFMDHMMPEMDGIATIRNVSMMDKNKCKDSIKIALTANAISGARDLYLKSGFDDYLKKPVQGEVLEAAIIKYLPENKVSYVDAVPEEKLEKEEEISLRTAMKLQRKVPGINALQGLKYCMNKPELYRNIMIEYTKQDYPDKLSKLLEDNNLEDYRILVHAMKSNSKNVGFAEIFEGARQLELAAKREDYEYIKLFHDEVMEKYIDSKNKLIKYFEDKEKAGE